MSGLNKKLIIFDLDGSVTKSKAPLDQEMAELITGLLAKYKVAIISGGGYPQFQTQFISRLPADSHNFSNLFLLPTSGTKLYTWKGGWHEEYAENLSERQLELKFLYFCIVFC
jgi:hydroxymethylpyrimidine pyrophosphatase-like HAD family hydrolase